jgi:peptidoglycan/LPS O-acetylase OafA/YrhL
VISPGAFRLLLASLVVMGHFSKIALGAAAVNLFFVLSGFWVYKMYQRKYFYASYPGLLFFASRLMRLIPTFLLFNALAAILHFFLQDNDQLQYSFIKNLPNIFILGSASLVGRPLVPSWSLDVEVQFYIIFPVIVLVSNWLHRYVWIILTPILAAGALYLAYFNVAFTNNVLPYMGFFLLGLATAQTKSRPPQRLTWTATALCFAGLLVIFAVPDLRGVLIETKSPLAFAWNGAANVMVALLLSPLALASVHIRSNQRDRMIGNLSYVIYCSHWLAVIIAAHYLSGVGIMVKAPIVAGLLAVTYAVSLIVLLFFDQPISLWRERWIERQLSPPANVATNV